MCLLWGTNWIYICYVEDSRRPLWSGGQSSWLHNGDVLCLLWGTNWIYICYVEESKPPLWSSGQSSWLQNGDVMCLLWGTNWIYICYVEESRPPLWSSGQSSWLQIQRSRVQLVSTIQEQLFEIKSSGSGLESREYGRRDPSRWPRGNPYLQKKALISQTSCGHSVGIVR
jgi:hypothetical protein